MFRVRTLIALVAVHALSACTTESPQAPTHTSAPAPVATASVDVAAQGNQLRMKIDGVDWVADNEIWGAVDALGAGGTVLISGNRGFGAAQQAFNLNLDGVDGAGSYRVAALGTPDHGMAQIGNLSEQRYLIGGAMFDHELQVELIRVQATPALIEARFHGTMKANDDSVVRIEDGLFRYAE